MYYNYITNICVHTHYVYSYINRRIAMHATLSLHTATLNSKIVYSRCVHFLLHPLTMVCTMKVLLLLISATN